MSRWFLRTREFLSRRRLGPDQATFLVGDGVFVAPRLGVDVKSSKVASRADYLAELAACPYTVGTLPAGPLREAHAIAQRVAELHFCFTQLLPALRGAAPPTSAPSAAPSLLTFQALERTGAELLRQLDHVYLQEGLGVWDAGLPAPTAIVSGAIVPLERVAAARTRSQSPRPGVAPHVTVDGAVYRLCMEDAQSIQEVERRVRRDTRSRLRRLLASDSDVRRLVEEVRSQAGAILATARPRDCGRYQLVHRDPTHQLHYSGGHWQLVRGPVGGPAVRHAVYVGLQIRGPGRRERLRRNPVPARTPERLWSPQGEPQAGAMCMGSRRQYQLLTSGGFTEAEAVIEWLDAGVILATGRPEYHEHWRQLAAARPRL